MLLTNTKISVSLGQLASAIAVLVSLSVAVGAYRSDFAEIKRERVELVLEIKALNVEMGRLRESFARVGQKLDDHIIADAQILEKIRSLR